ncbi:MAG: response regulator transcription factor [Pyrinomonadaceae bacterium]|nr:response regulator transcription factor [Pyrinomonadaceae bacterium]
MIAAIENYQTTVSNLRVVIIEDLREIREGLSALINGTAGFECVSSYGMMETALARIENDKPDAILTDLGLPGMSGTEGIIKIREIFPEIPIIALTIYDNDTEIFNALCNGANGYLLKTTPPARLLEALKEAANGGSPMSPTIAARVVNLFRTFRPPERSDYQLTPQETTLLKLLSVRRSAPTIVKSFLVSAAASYL